MTRHSPNEWFLENHGFLSDLNITIDDEESEFVRLILPYDETLTNPGSGVLQGGVVATLIDHAGGAAIRTTLERPLETTHATTDLNVSYIRPASSDLTAEGEVIRAGNSMGVVRVVVTDTSGKVVAEGRVSLHLDRTTGE